MSDEGLIWLLKQGYLEEALEIQLGRVVTTMEVAEFATRLRAHWIDGAREVIGS
jgi:hypothetical protein